MNLDELLNEGLDIWVADYHIATRQGNDLADVIKEGIDHYRNKLDTADQKRLDSMMDDTAMILENRKYDTPGRYAMVNESFADGTINENMFKKAIGGLTGFAAGPALGRALAKALGVERGSLLYEFLESRMVSSALGAALANEIGK